VDFGDLAGRRTRHLQCGLAGFELDNALILGNNVPFFDEQLEHVARINTITEAGKLDFNWHGSK
jgi:hypothetical protein